MNMPLTPIAVTESAESELDHGRQKRSLDRPMHRQGRLDCCVVRRLERVSSLSSVTVHIMGNRINRDYDRRTGRPLTDGRDIISVLTNEELEVEVTIAAAEPKWRA